MPCVSQAKNTKRWANSEIVDPELAKSEEYRAVLLAERGLKEQAELGTSTTRMAMVATDLETECWPCARCNGDEKPKRSWQEFFVEA